ncbi:hypothetical protein M758_7G141600 [Ceratodon purpureus]|nr:hypothetical protein M758_7G141600 [Ceratodon purpureus]
MPPNRSPFPPSRQCVLHPVKKKQKQEPSRFLPCPVCHRSFPSYSIHDHVNVCLDSPATGRTQSSPCTTSSLTPCNSESAHLNSESCDKNFSSTVDVEKDANLDDRLENPPAEQDCINSLLACSSPREGPLIENSSEIHLVDSSLHEIADEGDGDARIPDDEALRDVQNTEDCRQTNYVVTASDFVEGPKETEILVPELPQGEELEREAQYTMASPEEYLSDKPGHVLQIFQVQRQSQAKLSMLCKFPMSAALERKPTATVLQPGMVLLRSWLSMDIQQRLVNESQSAVHLFKRPTTASGGKYHLWQMAFGCQWDSKTRRYAPQTRGQRFPAWMYDLGRELAVNATDHTHVYPPGSSFAPDVALVNFYPVKDEELGVVGLGGHQDLDDYCDMPVVSVSVGDSMTFFYRRVPPQSRRKSGVQIVVDESAAKTCKDGDTAYNSEKRIILESGDVLVFGGESRLVYHGTRAVQPGTRPPGLHMVPGRLNFTFRQSNAPRL